MTFDLKGLSLCGLGPKTSTPRSIISIEHWLHFINEGTGISSQLAALCNFV
jgi:hypothetical protein